MVDASVRQKLRTALEQQRQSERLQARRTPQQPTPTRVISVDNQPVLLADEGFAKKVEQAEREVKAQAAAIAARQSGLTSESATLRPEVRRELKKIEEQISIGITTPDLTRTVTTTRFIREDDTRTNRGFDPDAVSTFGRVPTGETFREKAEGTIFTPKFFSDQERIARGIDAAIVQPIKSIVRGVTRQSFPAQIPSIVRDVRSGTPFVQATIQSQKKAIQAPDTQNVVITGATLGAGFAAGSARNIFVRKIARSLETGAIIGFGGAAGFTAAKNPTPENIGIALVSGIPAVGLGKRFISDIRTTTSSTFVPAEQLFDARVLAGKQTFPTASSIQQSLQFFRDANGFVITTGRNPLGGLQAGVGGGASRAGLQDPGVYVAPLGRGSPYFTGIDSPQGQSGAKFTFDLFTDEGTPTATVFRATAIETIPEEFSSVPGFSGVREFQQSQLGTGKAFITKRSQLGQGDLPRQTFTTTSGQRIRESGTSEIEAVLPPGTQFSDFRKGKFFTIFRGRPVRIDLTKIGLSENTPSSIRADARIRNIISSGASSFSSLSTPRVSIPQSVFTSRLLRSSVGSSRVVSRPRSTSSSSGSSISRQTVSSNQQQSSNSSFANNEFSSPSIVSSVSGSRAPSIVASISDIDVVGSPLDYKFIEGVSTPKKTIRVSSPGRLSSDIFTPSVPGFSLRKKSKNSREDGVFVVTIGKPGNKNFNVKIASSLEDAARIAKSVVGGGAAASFRITQNGQRLSGEQESFVKSFLGDSFRKSKVRSDTFVEKNIARINTAGEKLDITLKGLESLKSGRVSTSKKKTSKAVDFINQGFKLRDVKKWF